MEDKAPPPPPLGFKQMFIPIIAIRDAITTTKGVLTRQLISLDFE
jgi:hypothetical protein